MAALGFCVAFIQNNELASQLDLSAFMKPLMLLTLILKALTNYFLTTVLAADSLLLLALNLRWSEYRDGGRFHRMFHRALSYGAELHPDYCSGGKYFIAADSKLEKKPFPGQPKKSVGQQYSTPNPTTPMDSKLEKDEQLDKECGGILHSPSKLDAPKYTTNMMSSTLARYGDGLAEEVSTRGLETSNSLIL